MSELPLNIEDQSQAVAHMLCDGDQSVVFTSQTFSMPLVRTSTRDFVELIPGFSIVVSTLWPLLDRVGGSKSFYGYVVAAFRFFAMVNLVFIQFWAACWCPILRLLGEPLASKGLVLICFERSRNLSGYLPHQWVA
jgi:hypothetical protein